MAAWPVSGPALKPMPRQSSRWPTACNHFRWEYVKDDSDLGGADTAWIDDVTFPGFVDSDGDSMPDGWEIDNDMDPLIDDANGDADNDLFYQPHGMPYGNRSTERS